MTGREHKNQVLVGFKQRGPGFEQRGFFAVEGAASDDEAQVGSEGFQLAGRVGFPGGADVELQIAGD